MRDRDARLQQFFSGYFNQDWDSGGAESWRDVLAHYVEENPAARVDVIRSDLRSWLQGTNEGEGLPAAFGCDYDPRPDGVGAREWVRQLADFLEQRAAG